MGVDKEVKGKTFFQLFRVEEEQKQNKKDKTQKRSRVFPLPLLLFKSKTILPVVGAEHDADFDEPNSISRQPPLEPQQRDGVADAGARINELAHRDTRVGRLLSPVVADRRDDISGDAHDALLLGNRQVQRQRRGGSSLFGSGFGRRGLALGDQGVVGLPDGFLEAFERLRDHRPGFFQSFVFRCGGLGVAGARPSARVAELDLGFKKRGAGSRSPGDDGLRDPLFFQSVDESVLVDAAELL